MALAKTFARPSSVCAKTRQDSGSRATTTRKSSTAPGVMPVGARAPKSSSSTPITGAAFSALSSMRKMALLIDCSSLSRSKGADSFPSTTALGTNFRFLGRIYVRSGAPPRWLTEPGVLITQQAENRRVDLVGVEVRLAVHGGVHSPCGPGLLRGARPSLWTQAHLGLPESGASIPLPVWPEPAQATGTSRADSVSSALQSSWRP